MTLDAGPLGGLRRCAVLGSPIKHSLSPVLHAAAYANLGLNWTYERVEVDEERLAPCVESLDASWRGLSLTMALDKKSRGSTLRFVILNGLASAEILAAPSEDLLRAAYAAVAARA